MLPVRVVDEPEVPTYRRQWRDLYAKEQPLSRIALSFGIKDGGEVGIIPSLRASVRDSGNGKFHIKASETKDIRSSGVGVFDPCWR
jgi:hypothetical protein